MTLAAWYPFGPFTDATIAEHAHWALKKLQIEETSAF